MSKKKNVLIVTNSGNYGGMEIHVLNILEGLHNTFNFTVVCPLGNIVSEYKKYANVVNLSPKLDIDPLYIFRLIQLIKKLNIDVVHTHELKAGVNGLIAACLAGVSLRISHQHTPISMWRISKFRRLLDLFFYRNVVNHISTYEIALTPSIKSIKEREGMSSSKLVVIPNGVDVDKFNVSSEKAFQFRREICGKYNINPKAVIIGNVSRLTREKGHEIYLYAIKEVSNKNLKFMISGVGELEPVLRDLAKQLNIQNRVVFTGYFEEEEKVRLLSSFDIFVFPSLAEGFGIALLEAMAAGIPCLASDLPVLKDVGGNSVQYFKVGNSEDLKNRLLNILDNPRLREELSKRAKERAKIFDLKKFAERYKNLFSKKVFNN